MKIVLAEKVSPATLAVLKEEPGWEIVTADQIAKLAPADWKPSLPRLMRWWCGPRCKWMPSCWNRRRSCG